jgi:hypothetical protein
MMSQSASPVAALLGHVTHVPIKEGLHSVIKCLKNQDIAFSLRESAILFASFLASLLSAEAI